MKSRRNRRGGQLSFLDRMLGRTDTSATPASSTLATSTSYDNKMPDAMVSPEAQVLTGPTPEEKRSGSMAVDNAVNELYHLDKKFQNYHMRGIINAIGVCNSSEKAGNNLTGTFEVSECGPACKVRSEKVKAALTELLRIGNGNDALGYIGSGRVAVNSAGYLYNSGKSISRRLGLLSPAPGTPVGQPALATPVGQPVSGGRRTRRRR